MKVIDIKEDWSNNFNRIKLFLESVDKLFYEPLSLRVDLIEYSKRLSKKAKNIFLTKNGEDIGHIAFYINCNENKLFITSISVIDGFQGNGLGEYLLKIVKIYAKKNNYKKVELEADLRSEKLIKFYKKNGFHEKNCSNFLATMVCSVNIDI
ncbi:GNAT family N-acetyltransferase [Methylotuvimicrobium sp.]|uniref:GNAT family N-acetyltransferase n=1 Tax=Methylotuvimicrobium sp. TaxID=2822413 RepID=UPI003D655D65